MSYKKNKLPADEDVLRDDMKHVEIEMEPDPSKNTMGISCTNGTTDLADTLNHKQTKSDQQNIEISREDHCQCCFSSEQTSKRKEILTICVLATVIIGYFVYFGFALAWNFHKAIPLLVFTVFGVLLITKRVLQRFLFKSSTYLWYFGDNSEGKWWPKRFKQRANQLLERRFVKICCYVAVLCVMVIYVFVANYPDLESLKPVLGLMVMVVFSWAVSYDRSKVQWRPVIWGLGLQMCLGLFVLRTSVGAATFRFLGKQVEVYLDYVLAGVLFVFGDRYEDFFFVFKLMPIVIFLSSSISVAYHLGVMQWVINIIASAMSVTMGTTAAESTTTAACIFLGQPEASLTIKPFLKLMTRSELFAILTAGFASVSADVLSIFLNYGMSSADIITAILLSAPAGMAISKLMCPETEVSLTKTTKQLETEEKVNIQKSRNVIDAAATGAQDAIAIIAAVIATIIAFLSIFAFLNAIVSYLGSLVNIEGLTIDVIISYPLMPLAYLMGVPWNDCRAVGEVVGLKTFVNELVAYQRLSEMVKNGNIHSKRSEIVAMYALCGFSNPTSVGVALGGLSVMVPEKKEILSKIILMSWLAGSLACCMTATWAGLLYVEEMGEITVNSTAPTSQVFNTTMY